MPQVRTLQSKFNKGEFDPLLLGRSDIEQYAAGCETAKNVICLTQGGFKRRGGLKHVDKLNRQLTFLGAPSITAPNGGTGSLGNDRNAGTFIATATPIGTTNPYVVAQYDFGSAQDIGLVYLAQFSVSSGSSSEFYVQASNDATSWTNIGDAITVTTAQKNYSRRVRESYRYIRLARIGSTDMGSATATIADMNVYSQGAISNVKHMRFFFNSSQYYKVVVTDKCISIYSDDVLQTDIIFPAITNDMVPELKFTQSADTLIIFHRTMQTMKAVRQTADDDWITSFLTYDTVPRFAFTESSQTGSAAGLGNLTPSGTTGTVKLTLASGSWSTATHVGQYIEGNGGRARILSVATSASVANAYMEIPFFNTDVIPSTSYDFISGYEDAWSSTRGWPIGGAFHAGRLYIGGSNSLPTTVWGSRVGFFFDFDIGENLDDDAIEATIDKDFSEIANIYSGRDLIVFTTAAEYVAERPFGEPLTPSNFNLLAQSEIGNKENTEVFGLEGGIFYLQNGGRGVQEFIYLDTQQAYGNNLVSLLSAHLVSNAETFALRRPNTVEDGGILAMTRTDGKATIATVQRGQLIEAFTDHDTDGEFVACGVDYDNVYFTVKRTIDGTADNYLERVSDDHKLDASTRVTAGLPASTFSGLDHLEGKECRVYVDGSVLQKRTVSGGSVTIERDAEESFEIGLWFQPVVKDLPVEVPDLGTVIGKKMNVSEISLRILETQNVTINGKSVYFRGFGPAGGGSPLDAAPPMFTGIKRLFGNRGWDKTGQVTISQEEPGGLTVLSMAKKVTVY